MAEGSVNSVCNSQRNQINEVLRSSVASKGDTWYLLDNRWFGQWKKYVGYDCDTALVGDESANPGPIDNQSLFDGVGGKLRKNLLEELDYVLLPKSAWSYLVNWYSIVAGQEPIARMVIEQGMFVKSTKVEVYLMELKICLHDLPPCGDGEHVQEFSRQATVDLVMQKVRTLLSIPTEKEIRLWTRYSTNAYDVLHRPDATLSDSGIGTGQTVIVEVKNEDGTWPRDQKVMQTSTGLVSSTSQFDSTKSSIGAASSSGIMAFESYGGRGSLSKGLCGLGNLGNTCFMNSALQCLSNVPPLTRYFLNDTYLSELNYDNPLGMHGELAKNYAELIKTMWSGRYTSTHPRSFKVAVGRFAPQFSGFHQHDSQELMAFLLDGLHEDLNRIRKKPYVEFKDADGRADAVVAAETWEKYKKRNDSIVVDTFHGLLKSTLVCPDCNKVSVTFDPFCYLTLPLPMKAERELIILLVFMDPRLKPMKYRVSVSKLGTIRDLCKAVSRLSGVAHDHMIVTDVYHHKYHQIFNPGDQLSRIMDRDEIFVYELPVSVAQPQNQPSNYLFLPIYMREKRAGYATTESTRLFGQPLILAVAKHSCTYDQLYNHVLTRLARALISRPMRTALAGPINTSAGSSNNSSSQEPMDSGNGSMGGANDQDDDAVVPSTNGNAGESVSMGTRSNQQQEVPKRLFTFSVVNSFGTTEFDSLKDSEEEPISFNEHAYVSCDWTTAIKREFLDEKVMMEFATHSSVLRRHEVPSDCIQLGDCLDLFTTKEQLSQTESWYCPDCKIHREATKKFDLWTLPDYLIIHLKRFSFSKFWRDKIDTLVEFPAKGLDMRPYLKNPDKTGVPALYDLCAVSNHYGGMGGGHYTAYGLNSETQSWYYFDDTSVRGSSPEEVCTKAAYLLVYQRRHRKGVQTGTMVTTATNADSNAMASGMDID